MKTVLISGVQQSESAVHVHVALFLDSFPIGINTV